MIVANALPPMWKASSSFTLSAVGTSFTINRDDGLVISVQTPATNKLILAFMYDSDAMGGRRHSVTGDFTFEFESD